MDYPVAVSDPLEYQISYGVFILQVKDVLRQIDRGLTQPL